MPVYKFRGRQVPGMIDAADLQCQYEMVSEVGGVGMSLSVRYQHFDFEAELNTHNTENTETNVFTLRNIVEQSVRSHIDALGFLEGFGVDIEVFEVQLPDGKKVELFPLIPCLMNVKSNFYFAGKPIEFLQLVIASHQLQESLRAFRLAIREHGHTGAFCFQSIEAVKEHFRTAADFVEGRPLKQSMWDKFNTALRFEPSWTLEIPYFARPQRHGTPKANLDEERAEMFLRTAAVIDRFAAYLALGNAEPLPLLDYPILGCRSAPCLNVEEHRKVSK